MSLAAERLALIHRPAYRVFLEIIPVAVDELLPLQHLVVFIVNEYFFGASGTGSGDPEDAGGCEFELPLPEDGDPPCPEALVEPPPEDDPPPETVLL